MRYTQVSQQLIEELANLVMKGQSITLFAPRYGGKRHVMKRVRERLEELGQTDIVRLKLLGETPLLIEQELKKKLLQEIRNAGIEVPGHVDDPFEAIEVHSKVTGKRVILLISNIDAIAHNLTRQLLEHFRSLVQKERLAVVLSGESDFVELVHGPNSYFNCSENFFLQGHTEEDFRVFLNQYNKALSITLDKPEEIQSHFWRRTGGSTYLVRPLIVEVIEIASRASDVITARPLTMKDFERMPSSKNIPGNYWTQLCRHATRIVAMYPDCWPSLRQLISEGQVKVEEGHKPTQLEWAGIAVRDCGYLKFASEMMENYARSHYTDLHWGDLYGRNGLWEDAFDCYEQLLAEQRRRPLSADDRTETGKNISALGRALFSVRTVDEVRSLFARGCRNLLGFGEVTFWRYEKENGWQFRQLNGSTDTPSEALASQIERILGNPDETKDEFFCIPADWHDTVVAAKLESVSTDYACAVVVSDLNNGVTLSPERRRLLKSLLQQFIEAHNHAAKVQKAERRLTNRDMQMDLLNSIFKAMGSQVTDVDGVLRRAAGGLLSLGYKRVLFCLVDPKRERIQGVFDHSNDWPGVDIAKMTDYPLDDINSDVQSYVIATGIPFSTADAGKETRTHKAAVEKGKMKGVAIIPILNHAGKAIGTIHLERIDQLEPSKEDIEDILTFGRLLGTAIEQAERINLLQSTLDQIPDPVAVVGVRKGFRYANKAAADLIGVKNRWYDQGESQIPLADVQPAIRKAAEQALEGQRFFKHIGTWDGQVDTRSILSNRLTDWRDKTVGAFLYLQELTDFYRVFKSFLTIASRKNTGEALEAMQEAVGQLGYPESRLYVVEPISGHLVSQKWYGATDLAKASLFNQHYFKSPFGEMATSHTWKSIVLREPLVFCFKPDGQEGQIGKTPQGLEYFVTNEREEQQGGLGKKSGDIWIDLPLLAEDRPLGKLIIPCSEYLRPESFELLKVLFNLDSVLLDEFAKRTREQNNRDLLVEKQTAEKVMGDMAHNIATKFAALPGYLSLYRYYEKRLPELKEVNDDFKHALDQTQAIVRRAKERLSPIRNLKCEQTELKEYLERLLKSHLQQGYSVVSEIELVPMNMDTHLLEIAFAELIENSKAIHEDPERLKIEIRIRHADQADGTVRIIYRDNGPGIAEEVRPHIFEDFFSHRPSAERASSGLGMGFVKRVITAHNGNIEVGSSDTGAEFLITLPRNAANDNRDNQSN
ncbi:MAG: ATP-binding protein [Acidobacteriota bacterium]|nr:ATP-binding protein [Acidobacteriota bacterium]